MRLLWQGGGETRQHLRELEHAQWLPRSELKVWQLEKIQRLVKYAYEHVPYYREWYQREDIHPKDVKSWQDFQSLPFLTKEIVNERLDDLVVPEMRGQLHPESTGGSTGRPMRFFVENSFWWWNAALEIRGRGWYSLRPGDKTAWIWGAAQDLPDQSRKERLKARVMRHRFLNAFSMSAPKMEAFARMLVRWQPRMFRAYPSAISLFAEFLREQGITGIRPRIVETSAEKVSDTQRELIEDVFACPVVDCYSGRELGTIAYQCPDGGLHVCETRHVEIIAHDRPSPPGQLGEIAITSLHQFAMPLIRYKNGDMGIYQSGGCACGRGLPVLQEIVGRVSDFLLSGDGQFVHSTFFARVFRRRPRVARYQIYQPDREHLEARFICKQVVDQPWLDDLRAEIQTRFGPTVHVTLQAVDDIPLTPAGKHRFVISQVKADFSS